LSDLAEADDDDDDDDDDYKRGCDAAMDSLAYRAGICGYRAKAHDFDESKVKRDEGGKFSATAHAASAKAEKAGTFSEHHNAAAAHQAAAEKHHEAGNHITGNHHEKIAATHRIKAGEVVKNNARKREDPAGEGEAALKKEMKEYNAKIAARAQEQAAARGGLTKQEYIKQHNDKILAAEGGPAKIPQSIVKPTTERSGQRVPANAPDENAPTHKPNPSGIPSMREKAAKTTLAEFAAMHGMRMTGMSPERRASLEEGLAHFRKTGSLELPKRRK
jgi:hypothetical protein